MRGSDVVPVCQLKPVGKTASAGEEQIIFYSLLPVVAAIQMRQPLLPIANINTVLNEFTKFYRMFGGDTIV